MNRAALFVATALISEATAFTLLKKDAQHDNQCTCKCNTANSTAATSASSSATSSASQLLKDEQSALQKCSLSKLSVSEHRDTEQYEGDKSGKATHNLDVSSVYSMFNLQTVAADGHQQR